MLSSFFHFVFARFDELYSNCHKRTRNRIFWLCLWVFTCFVLIVVDQVRSLLSSLPFVFQCICLFFGCLSLQCICCVWFMFWFFLNICVFFFSYCSDFLQLCKSKLVVSLCVFIYFWFWHLSFVCCSIDAISCYQESFETQKQRLVHSSWKKRSSCKCCWEVREKKL